MGCAPLPLAAGSPHAAEARGSVSCHAGRGHYFWQALQKWVLRPPSLTRSMAVPQT